MQYISPAGIYGAERWIMALIANLDHSKVQSSVVVNSDSGLAGKELIDACSAMGFEGHVVRLSHKYDLLGVFRLAGLIRRAGVTIIHTHGYKSDILGLIAARLAGIKAVSTAHGFENAKDMKLKINTKLGCLASRYFDAVVPLSAELYRDMEGHGVKRERLHLIRNGVDLGDVDEAMEDDEEPFYQEQGEKRIAYVGQLILRKNIEDMIRGFALLHKSMGNVRLVLIGEGECRLKLEKLSRELGCADRVDFLGFRQDRLKILKSCHLFTMTSSLEGIPRAAMEAMALGLPFAAFNIPGINDLIEHGRTGMMADNGNVEGLVACWERLLTDEGFREGVARAGQELVRREYSAKRMADEYQDLFSELLA